MSVQSLLAITAVCVCLIALPAQAAEPLDCSDASREELNEISAKVEAFKAKYKIPGISVAFVRNGHQQYLSYGVASVSTQVAVSPDTLFEVGSVSKTFSATLAAYAARKRKLSLDDPVALHLPGLASAAVGRVPLWQLGTHSAGGFPLQFPAGLDNAGAMDYYMHWQPKYEGGSVRSYANPSIALLGVATASAMKTSYRSAMQNELFPKLGLSNTWLEIPDARAALYAQGYNAKGEPVRLEDGPFAEEAYGVRSSARDLLAFLEQNIEPATRDRLLDQALLDTQRPYFAVGSMMQGLIWESYQYPIDPRIILDGSAPGFSLIDQKVNSTRAGLSKRAEVIINKTGGTGGFGTYVAFVPSRHVGVVILTNHANPTVERVALGLEILEIVDRGQGVADISGTRMGAADSR
ncbi:class C beta-lactamase [Stenotrophomonas sp. YAU14A_MKIMI4_1]|uniref:class C beta-lactamase n=1 Tax=Stenotrophomonas sp. YAU14A_MKIMI4_1 TaxID=2072408 RepID=UPI000D53FC1B|nr:class C beta-lactamase [Stenotrophomonas sp. YAU14A_MKIMI4_1]AWH29586.1 class C beta-lactamase [Stenotrophomonas sp. YAU14A_MKIMI4_1]